MQGGLIVGAIDNAVGPFSLLVAPKNMTRNIESKLLKPIGLGLIHFCWALGGKFLLDAAIPTKDRKKIQNTKFSIYDSKYFSPLV